MSRRISPNRAAVTMPIPVAAALAGVSRQAGYSALASGAFPGVEVGGRRLVLTEPFCRMFSIAPDDPRIAIAYQMTGYGEPPASLRHDPPPQPVVGRPTPAPTPRKRAKAKTKTKAKRAKTGTRRATRKPARKSEVAPAAVPS
jgi:hypothetical protein